MINASRALSIDPGLSRGAELFEITCSLWAVSTTFLPRSLLELIVPLFEVALTLEGGSIFSFLALLPVDLPPVDEVFGSLPC